MTDALDDAARAALSRNGVIDMTTIGRRSGEARRIEIYLHSIDGRLIISGRPAHSPRAWLLNLEADPRVTIHLKGPAAHADLTGTARIVTDSTERRALLERVAANWGRTDVDAMVRHSPLIEVTIPGFPTAD